MSFPDEYRASSSSWEAVSAHPSPCLQTLNPCTNGRPRNILTLTLRMSRTTTVPPRVESLVKHADSKRFATRLLRGAARDNFGSAFNLAGKLRCHFACNPCGFQTICTAQHVAGALRAPTHGMPEIIEFLELRPTSRHPASQAQDSGIQFV